MPSTPPLISIIVPVFNAGPYLNKCLESIERQTYTNLEIICINDGSTDDSLSIIKDHASKDSRIVVIDKGNEGYGATCNRGFDSARGHFISIIEPDDWIEPQMCQSMIEFMQSFDEEIDIVKSAYWRIVNPDTPKQMKLNCSFKNRINPPSQPFKIHDAPHLLRHHPSIWSALYRRKYLEAHSIRFKEIPGAGWADNPFLIETLCQAERIIYTDEAYYCYREETCEQYAVSVKMNPFLLFERWNDMMDILLRLNITDKAILNAHNSRGFVYSRSVVNEVGLNNRAVREACRYMYSRMNPDLVFGNPNISPKCKKLFAELLCIPLPRINRLAYLGSLFEQGVYTLRNTGLRFTLFSLGLFFRKQRRLPPKK